MQAFIIVVMITAHTRQSPHSRRVNVNCCQAPRDMRVNYYIKNRLDSPCVSAVYINCGNRASRVNGVSVALRLDIAKTGYRKSVDRLFFDQNG